MKHSDLILPTVRFVYIIFNQKKFRKILQGRKTSETLKAQPRFQNDESGRNHKAHQWAKDQGPSSQEASPYQASRYVLFSKDKMKILSFTNLLYLTGVRGTLESLRPTVASLIMHERLELEHNRAQWAREYTERLISEAVLHGDKHKETMEVSLDKLVQVQL